MATEMHQSPSEEATLAARGYKLGRKLGEGSYAKVYLAEYNLDANPRKPQLACKVVDTTKAPKDFVRKFLPRELDILVKVNHPHIVYVHSIFQHRSKYYIFLRYAENGDLLDFVLKNGAVAESQARVWLRQLALAVQYLHEMEIAHRDLKCENVLISANFNVKLADFGFARYVVDSRGKRQMSDTYCGSLSYAAPEILRGIPYNPKISDIWSLGVVLYVMLNKAMPFDDTNIKRLYEQQTSRRWKFRGKVVDVLSDQLKKVVQNMLEPDIVKRWHFDHVLNSEWIAMDPRLLVLTPAEQQAVELAVQAKKAKHWDTASEGKGKVQKAMRSETSSASKKGDTVTLKEAQNAVPDSNEEIV
ncbi:hypothetical protein L9F63_001547 [Diploptera punctata]|uniref:Protein kinase domain-containing protein n=1 Tax=Diploptera punctata TaxID=6984 RepID=A0AAD8A4F5_DIPPU|nr:hypothetical protein L9F63_001547 [Diploptera punctata]